MWAGAVLKMDGNNALNGAQRGRVLVIEDDADTREAVSDFLEREGFEVEAVENGHLALESLRSRDAPRFILLDMMMPVMDGWSFRRQQRADPQLSSIPVIVVTAGQ